ncbi:MAG TPA: hypothetical protein VGM29_01455 [Polyangiaceae bacterium]
MKRLLEHASDACEEHLAELFEAAEAPSADPFRKRRILVRIERGEGRRLGLWLRPAVVAVLLVSGTAAAALSKGLINHKLWPNVAPVDETPAAVAALAPRPALAPVLGPPAAPAAPEAVASDATPPEPSKTDSVTLNSSAPAKAAHRAARPRPGSEDPTDVVQAIQALRTDRDPSRAQTLLDDYLQTHPKGQLSEDALALSIEAASAKHDPRATDYARRYLGRFPHGRYRDVAARALASH